MIGRVGVRRPLGIEGRTETPVGPLHHPGIRISGRHPRLFSVGVLLVSFHLRQWPQRLPHPVASLPCGTGLGGLWARIQQSRVFLAFSAPLFQMGLGRL